MQPGAQPWASVIVPTRAGGRRLERLLASLAQQSARHEVVVVDNASGPETDRLLATRFPDARVVRLPENAGFGRAVNRGVEAASANVIVVTNDDVVCEPEFVARLVTRLAPGQGVVMAAGVLLSASDAETIDSAGIMFDRTLLAWDYLHGERVTALDGDVPDPLGPTGGAAAFDRAAFEAAGGFDEAFFAYLEDVDLTARLVSRGGRCSLARDARAVHEHSATLGSGSADKNALMGWSRGYTIGKYRLHRRPRALGRVLAGELAIAGGQLVVDRTPASVASRLRGFRAGLAAQPQTLPELPRGAADVSLADVLRQRKRRRRR